MKIKLRPHQEKVLNTLLKNCDRYERFFINMPTGGGKTVVVLKFFEELRDIGLAKQLFVFTRTRNEFAPYLRDIKKFEADMRYVYLIAKRDLCTNPRMWGSHVEDVNPCEVCEIRRRYLDPSEVFGLVMHGADLKRFAKNLRFCGYYSVRRAIAAADVVALTYPYGFTPRIKIFEKDLGCLGSSQMAVVDEAHNLENVSDLYSRVLTVEDVERIRNMTLVENEVDEYDLNALMRWLEKVRNAEELLLNKNEVPGLDVEPCELMLKELLAEYIETEDRSVKRELRECMKSVSRLWRFYTSVGEEDVELFSHRNGVRLRMILPKEPIRMFSRVFRRAVFMSGTLPPPDYIEKIWGLGGLYIDVEDDLKNFGRRTFYCDRSLTTKYEKREAMIPKICEVLGKLLNKLHGVKLVVFPSYDFMSKILSRFDDAKENFIVEEKRTTIKSVEEEVGSGKDVLFAVAGGKLTEGIELVDEKRQQSLIKHVIMVGVPYPEVSPYMESRTKKIAELVGSSNTFRYAYHVPALLLTKQAIGRAVRFENDEVNVWLLDERFVRFARELKVGKLHFFS